MNSSRIIAIVLSFTAVCFIAGCQRSDAQQRSSAQAGDRSDTTAIRRLADAANAAANASIKTSQTRSIHSPPDMEPGWTIAETEVFHERRSLIVRDANYFSGGDCFSSLSVLTWGAEVQLLTASHVCDAGLPVDRVVDSVFFSAGSPTVVHQSIEEPSTYDQAGQRIRLTVTESSYLACAKRFAEVILKADIKAIETMDCSVGHRVDER